jgi:DNA-binding NarL/FixJ family response regulator
MIVADRPMIRLGLAAMLESQPRFAVVGFAEECKAALASQQSLDPDLVLVDLCMASCGGIETSRLLRQKSPSARIILVGEEAFEADLLKAQAIRANGFILKTISPEDLAGAVAQVYDQGWCLPFGPDYSLPETLSSSQVLSARELEVLDHLRRGQSNDDISKVLHISINTVLTHVRSVFAKLHVANRAEAVSAAYERGYARVSTQALPQSSRRSAKDKQNAYQK